MRQLKLVVVGCMMSILLLDGCAARPEDPKPPLKTYTIIEPFAFLDMEKEKDPYVRIKFLDSWLPLNPDSTLMPFAYHDYIVTYSSISGYPQVIVYADKLLSLGSRIDLRGRLEALAYREEAYRSGCAAREFQTHEAYNEAKDAANQGLQMLGDWQKPAAMSDEAFRASKSNMEMLFNTVSRLADLGMRGENITNLCGPSSPQNR